MPVFVDNPDDVEGVRVVTLSRPERRNALDHGMLQELRTALTAARDDEVRVLVLTGAASNFCAGADLSTVEDGDFVDELRATLEDLRTLPAPVIAAIHGPALGAGTQLAMACDLRIATPDATFGIPAAKLGLTVDYFTVHHLAGAVGHSIARAMLTGAEVFDAAALHRSGFIHRLVDEGTDVRDAGIAWASRVAQLAPLTITAHKLMLADVETVVEPTDATVTARAAAWNSEDLAEGLASFAERRRPTFRGH